MTTPGTAPEVVATAGSNTYWPALDGLRAVAVVAVVLYHGGATSQLSGLAPGGFIGVSVFFTLSGFLVTGLLLRNRAAPATAGLGQFWVRRLKRLAPASLVVVLATVSLAPLLWRGMKPSDALAGTFGYTNWHVIVSGPDALLRTIVGPLGPYWSLAVEEQFYLGISIAVVMAWRTRRPVRAFATFVAIGWCGSAAVQLLANWPNYRLEFGTEVRASELLAGAALAIWLHCRPGLAQRWGSRLQPVGVLALAIVIGLAATTDYDPPWLLRGGYAALSLLNAALVLSLLGAGRLTRALSATPLVLVGRLSYSWYLVHWPVMLALTPDRLGVDGWALLGAKLAVSLGLAVVLHRLVEAPLRRLEVPGRAVVGTWMAACVAISLLALVTL